MTTERDLKMGRALESIPLPELRDGYYAELTATLEQDRQAVQRRRRRRPRMTRARLAAAAAVAAAILAVAALGGHHAVRDLRQTASGLKTSVRELRYPPAASAAEVASNVRLALGNTRTISADVTEYFKVVEGPKPSEWREAWTTADWWARARIYSDEEFKSLGWENGSPYFPAEHEVLTAAGQWYLKVVDNPLYVGDKAAGLMTTSDDEATSVTAVKVLKDTSLGAPDGTPGAVEMSLQFIRSSTLATMAGGDLRRTTFEGRPALTISCAIAPVPIKGLNMDAHEFDTVAFTVDKKTWLIVRTAYLLRGQVIWETRLSHVRINAPLRPAVRDALVRLKEGEGTATSQGFRRVPWNDAATQSSTRPLTPGTLPSGFRPFAAAAAEHHQFLSMSDSEGTVTAYWPPSVDVTQLSYRAGCLEFLVTTRKQPPPADPDPDDPLMADPFDSALKADGGSTTGHVEALTLTGGAWRGATAHVVTQLLEPPHLWAWRDGVLVTIGGDLTREQLLAVANSLEPME